MESKKDPTEYRVGDVVVIDLAAAKHKYFYNGPEIGEITFVENVENEGLIRYKITSEHGCWILASVIIGLATPLMMELL